MATKGVDISSLQLTGEGTTCIHAPVQEINRTASSKMVAGMEARASLQLAGEGVFSEPCVCCCRYNRNCPLHQETGQDCSVLVTPRATCELGTQQETGQGCSLLVTPRATCELGTQQETGQGCSLLVTPRATCELGTQQETGQGCSLLVTPRATCELGTQQETGQGCSLLVTPRATCELGTQQETGQGCSVLVTPRATCELGTQQGAARVLTASNSTPSVTSRNRGQGVCQEVDIVITGISNTRSCSSLDNTGAICGAAIQEVNPQATSMLVTGHESRLNSKK